MPLSLQIAFTGFAVFAMSLLTIHLSGRRPPRWWMAIQVFALFGSIATVFVGTLMFIWR